MRFEGEFTVLHHPSAARRSLPGVDGTDFSLLLHLEEFGRGILWDLQNLLKYFYLKAMGIDFCEDHMRRLFKRWQMLSFAKQPTLFLHRTQTGSLL